MTNLVNDNFIKMYKMMSQHKFAIGYDVNEDYKCEICKNIIANAHQAICGCNFCFECINKYISNGALNCPNNTEECELESLSRIVPNYRMNKLISKLIVRCSNKMCSHECKLIEMENHLNSCLNKSLKCPFIDFGCEHDDMINDKLNDHMLSDIHNHNKILIDLIGNLRNKMRELNENDRMKNEIIESMKEEIKFIKQENKNLTKQMEIGDQNLWSKFDEIDIEMKNKCKKMREEKLDNTISNEIDRYLDMRDDGAYYWLIGHINEIKERSSEMFYGKQNPYQMNLALGNINNELNIWLCIHSGEFDDDLKWPCQAEVTIHISASNDEYYMSKRFFRKSRQIEIPINNSSKSVTKLCKIEKPAYNSYKSGNPIKISHSDLTKSNLLNIICQLNCTVKFK